MKLRLKRLLTPRMKLTFVALLCVGVFATLVFSRTFDSGPQLKGDLGDLSSSFKAGIYNEDVADLSTLRLVHVMFRHGDRTPIDRYPKDPYNSRKFWPEGFGRLTRLGKLMQFNLGQYLRHRYDGFLSREYVYDEIYVRSSDIERAIMSAMANVVGLYPPTAQDLSFPEGSRQQYVPIHTLSASEDNKIAFTKDCPKYAKELNDLQDDTFVKKFHADNAELYKYLKEHTGMNVTSYANASDIFDILFCQRAHNFTLPDWTTAVFPDKILPSAELWMSIHSFTDTMKVLKAGPIMLDMVRNMKRMMENPSEDELKILQALFHTPAAKFYVYSGHDSTLSAVLDALGLYSGRIPPYASSLIFELHELAGPKRFVVKIFYRPDITKPAEELHFTKCPSQPCLFEDFMASLKSYMVDEKEWAKLCSLN